MNDFIKILNERFGAGEPIFTEDILNAFSDTPRSTVFYRITSALEDKSLCKYIQGVYYIPQTIKVFDKKEVTLPLDPDKIIERKYITSNGEVCGFISGLCLQNKYGISNQVPAELEITTNVETNRVRRVTSFGGYKKITLRKPKTSINRKNVAILEAIDLIGTTDISSLDKDELKSYKGVVNSISSNELAKYIMLYPKSIINKYLKGVSDGVISA